MEYSRLEHFISQPRLNRFLQASNNSKSQAQRLYRVNLRVSQAFYPVLNLFEIFLRNRIDIEMSLHFRDPNWIISQKTHFMSDQTLRARRFYLKNCVRKAENAIARKRGTISSGKVIAEQTFGFWTCLFDTHHYRLIGGCVIHCFPFKPPQVNRNILNQKLDLIREFRNRVYHNEPICFNNHGVADFINAEQAINTLYELLNWMDPEIHEYVEYFNAVQTKITKYRTHNVN